MATKAKTKKTQSTKKKQPQPPYSFKVVRMSMPKELEDELFGILREQLFLKEENHQEQDICSNVLLKDLRETFGKCLATAVRKNADYAGIVQTDPYKNLRGSEFVGVDPARAILVRMMDKMSRISNLLNQEAQVKDEAIEDTLDDMVNYAAILKSYIKNNKKKTDGAT